ncbi:tetratricopeptide repeat protein [Mariniflexile gromovii]|uniref:Tetratricopeptide repeat protein n=1 Tax=Mariniflexile gromovii TaxID=362523 RepID=A0ABS4BYH0_9FLAO|nr:tetratricopeptide repeat protein [Mariniflexile gromovii]MBP0905627.1 tetratricopeptide repeat protein [Mariniflexile gromovii]
MKHIILIIITLTATFSFSQEKDKEALLAAKKANNYVYEANNLINEKDFVSAEKEYRKAISEQATSVAGIYNLGSSYIKKGNLEEALYRLDQAAKIATSKEEKHKAYHNIGNVLMENKKCQEAVEAYKNALRNDPTDEETRYNLGLAKICAEQQKDNQDDKKDDKDNKDKKDDKKDQDKKEGDDKKDQDQKDKGDQDQKEGDDKKDDKGKPKDEKDDKGKGDEKQQPQQPRPGQMSPQQVKSLLEAMNNQEQKVQEKVNAEKQKGIKVKTDKDW